MVHPSWVSGKRGVCSYMHTGVGCSCCPSVQLTDENSVWGTRAAFQRPRQSLLCSVPLLFLSRRLPFFLLLPRRESEVERKRGRDICLTRAVLSLVPCGTRQRFSGISSMHCWQRDRDYGWLRGLDRGMEQKCPTNVHRSVQRGMPFKDISGEREKIGGRYRGGE